MAAPHLSPAKRAGDLVFTSGQLGFVDGKIVGDVAAQTAQTIANIATVLAADGLSLTDIVKTTVWLTRREDFAAFNIAYAQAFGDHKPARSTTICALAIEEALIEIEAIASLSRD